MNTPTRRRRSPVTPLIVAFMVLLGMGLMIYPSTASWFSSKNQSKVIRDFTRALDHVEPSVAKQIAEAHAYNRALSAGVVLGAGANVPVGEGVSSDESLVYDKILTATDDGMMGRIRIPAIDADLPIYHGTDDDTLLRGAGHLEGSHLPVGGSGTHSVITAHRGLANATMFTYLNKVKVGDTFTLEILGKVLTYRVRETRVVEPDDTDTLRPVAGEDLVTLVTCTPLGINSHRILVTGERITPTPTADERAAGAPPEIPGFPWWAVALGLSVAGVGAYVWVSLRPRRP